MDEETEIEHTDDDATTDFVGHRHRSDHDPRHAATSPGCATTPRSTAPSARRRTDERERGDDA